MSLQSELRDRYDDLSKDAQSVVDRLMDDLERQEDQWDALEDNLARMADKQTHLLYVEQGIPYEAAKEFQQYVDACRDAAGMPRIFEPLEATGDDPAELYKIGDYKPEGILEKLGEFVW